MNNMDYYVGEVKLSYQKKSLETRYVRTAEDAYTILRPTYSDEDIEYRESFKVLFMNQNFKVLGWTTISEGGITETPADIRMILQAALLCNATCITVCHNHPSGNLIPSRDDDRLTEKIRKACEIMRIHLVDHLILTDNSYYSYREKGRL